MITCPTGKRVLRTYKKGLRALDRARADRQKHNSSRHENHVYHCDQCGHWHLTSTGPTYAERDRSWAA